MKTKEPGIWISLTDALREYQSKSNHTYIITRYGMKIDFMALDRSGILLDDIAHGLSNECRYAGQTPEFYSVAEHSVLVSIWAENSFNDIHLTRAALLHDAPEAYIGDITTPLKNLCPGFKLIEKGIEEDIFYRFSLQRGLNAPEVRVADRRLFELEAMHFWPEMLDEFFPVDIPRKPHDWELEKLPILSLGPEEAKTLFLKRAKDLGIE